MKTLLFKIVSAAFLVGIGWVSTSYLARAQPLQVSSGQSIRVDTDDEFATVIVADPYIAEVINGWKKQIVLLGKTPGSTTVLVYDSAGAVTELLEIEVRPGIDALRTEIGLAIVYGDEFGGLPTANGEEFSNSGISAAHPTLPLPSIVHVVNLESGQSGIIRVNDRGPYTEGATLELSQGAAKLLGVDAVRGARVSVTYFESIE